MEQEVKTKLKVQIRCFDLQAFLVRKSASLQKKVISVRMDQNWAEAIREFPVRENQYSEHQLISFLFTAYVSNTESQVQTEPTGTKGSVNQLQSRELDRSCCCQSQ